MTGAPYTMIGRMCISRVASLWLREWDVAFAVYLKDRALALLAFRTASLIRSLNFSDLLTKVIPKSILLWSFETGIERARRFSTVRPGSKTVPRTAAVYTRFPSPSLLRLSSVLRTNRRRVPCKNP